MRYAYIGLGNLGGHLAASLAKAGFPLVVHDRDPGLRPRFDALGADWADVAAEAAAEADAVITCLPSPAVSEAVLAQILPVMKPGADWIEMSTLGRAEMLRLAAVLIAQVLQVSEAVAHRTARLEDENRDLRSALERTRANFGVLGESPAIRACLAQLARVADTTATVLLLGESGTGKELFAKALHLAGARRDGPFVKVNCAALPETLVEAELFGYEKGAFTGAAGAHAGRFEQADGGTLFLDEVGELPLSAQAKMLRALQDRTVTRLGGKRDVAVDTRVVAATNRDLARAVAGGAFRADLYYRLNVVPLALPALRERGGDAGLLARHFFQQSCLAYQRRLSLDEGALGLLAAHGWPGNVRQLHNVVERLVLLAEGPVVSSADVRSVLSGDAGFFASPVREASVAPAAAIAGRPVDADALRAALAAARGNKSRAAQALGLTLRQFDYRLKKLGA